MRAIAAMVSAVVLVSVAGGATNYVYYSVEDGMPRAVAGSCSYEVAKDKVTMGDYAMGGIDWSVVRVGSFAGQVPVPFTNVSQVSLSSFLPQTEAERQSRKSEAAKDAENNFLLVCGSLTGSMDKLGFGDLRLLIADIKTTNFQAAADLSMSLLSIDSELKRECGEKWWDDCVWHPEMYATAKQREGKRLSELKKGRK